MFDDDLIIWGEMSYALIWAGLVSTIWLLSAGIYRGFQSKCENSILRRQLLETRKLVARMEIDFERRLYDLEACVQFPDKPDPIQYSYAGKAGRFDVIKRLQNPRIGGGVCPWDKTAFYGAARSGNLEMLKWLCDPNTGAGTVPWVPSNFDAVLRSGNTEMADWVYEFMGGNVLMSFATGALHRGDIKMMEWLRNPNTGGGVCPWNAACTQAMRTGSVDPIRTLEWLRDPNTGGGVCPWDASACVEATRRQIFDGHSQRGVDSPMCIRLLEWLRSPDTGGGVCPWDKLTWVSATQEVKAWLLDPSTGGGACPQL
jgi:hypothetical protein